MLKVINHSQIYLKSKERSIQTHRNEPQTDEFIKIK